MKAAYKMVTGGAKPTNRSEKKETLEESLEAMELEEKEENPNRSKPVGGYKGLSMEELLEVREVLRTRTTEEVLIQALATVISAAGKTGNSN